MSPFFHHADSEARTASILSLVSSDVERNALRRLATFPLSREEVDAEPVDAQSCHAFALLLTMLR